MASSASLESVPDVSEKPNQPLDFAFPKRQLGKPSCQSLIPGSVVSDVSMAPLRPIPRPRILSHLRKCGEIWEDEIGRKR